MKLELELEMAHCTKVIWLSGSKHGAMGRFNAAILQGRLLWLSCRFITSKRGFLAILELLRTGVSVARRSSATPRPGQYPSFNRLPLQPPRHHQLRDTRLSGSPPAEADWTESSLPDTAPGSPQAYTPDSTPSLAELETGRGVYGLLGHLPFLAPATDSGRMPYRYLPLIRHPRPTAVACLDISMPQPWHVAPCCLAIRHSPMRRSS